MRPIDFKIKRFLFLIFPILLQCEISNKSSRYDDALINYLSVNQIAITDQIAGNFDAVLNHRYSAISNKFRVRQYLIDLKTILEKQDIHNLAQFIKTDWNSSDFLEGLIKSHLFEEVYIDGDISDGSANALIQKWVDSINLIDENMPNRPKYIVHLLDSQNTELQIEEMNKIPNNISIVKAKTNYYDKFYHALYRSLSKKDIKIKNFIISKIEAGDISPLVILNGILDSFDEKELNNKILKQIIYVEFILPFYLNIGMDE